MTPLSEERRVILHHVGSRGTGWRLLPSAKPFAREIVNVLYDADQDCVAQTQSWWDANADCETIVRQCCVLDRDGETDFYLNYDPYTSSVLPFNERFTGYSVAVGSTDYPLEESMQAVEMRRMATRSLDSLVAAEEVPPPDFLSLDTQGSEFEILVGARETIRTSTVAIATEVTMSDLYAGQKTFADIHALLLDMGFELAELDTSAGYVSRFRGPLGARGRRELLQAATVYLRRPETVSGERRTLALFKLAFIAILLGHVEYALGVLQDARASWDAEVDRDLETFRYLSFLRDVETAAAGLHERLPTFRERYTLKQSLARFQPDGVDVQASQSPMRHRPSLVRFTRARMRSALLRTLQWRFRRHAGLAAPSQLEAVFADYGVDSVAELLRERRLQTYDFTGSPSQLLRMLWRGVY